MKEEAERIRLENQALMKKEREEQEKQSKRPAGAPQQDSGEEQKQQQPPQQQQQQQQAGAPKTPAGRSVGRIGSCVDMVTCSNIGMENCTVSPSNLRPKRERKIPAHLKGDFESPFAPTPVAGGGEPSSREVATTSSSDQNPETSAEVLRRCMNICFT